MPYYFLHVLRKESNVDDLDDLVKLTEVMLMPMTSSLMSTLLIAY